MTTSGEFTTYSIPFGDPPTALTAGPDGAIWFGTDGWDVIGRVTTSGVFSEYTAPGDVGQVSGITTGPDGALWFTNYTVPGDSGVKALPPIGRITTSGSITTYESPSVQGALSITVGSDGAMWFNDHLNDAIGRISVP
jgi:virginiamycin B lyase